MQISIHLLHLLSNQYPLTPLTFNSKSTHSTYRLERLWHFGRITGVLPLSLFRPIGRCGGLSDVGKVIGPFLTSNSVGRVGVRSNSVSGEDRSDIGGVGVRSNSVMVSRKIRKVAFSTRLTKILVKKAGM